MRTVALLVALPFVLTTAALAQNAAPNQQQAPQNAQSPQMIQQKVQKNLQEAGFTDIKIMPSSFLVRAKDKDGNPVMMVINPDSITAVTAIPGQGNTTTGQGNNNQTNQPPAAKSGPGAGVNK
jgi:hypothetical protein